MVSRAQAEDERARGKRERVVEACYRVGLLPVIRQLRALVRHDLRILAYHRVLDVDDPNRFDFDLELISASAQRFHDQMSLIKRRMHPMRFDEVLDLLDRGKTLPVNALVVTFDDGYDDNYRVAWPILRELGMTATFFVSTGYIDSGLPYAYDWLVHMVCMTPETQLELPEIHLHCTLPDNRAKRRAIATDVLDRLKWLDDAQQSALICRLEHDWRMPRSIHPACRPMTWEQLREMQASGMEIGSHGVSHRMLAKVSADDIRAEIFGSKESLERELGKPAKVLRIRSVAPTPTTMM